MLTADVAVDVGFPCLGYSCWRQGLKLGLYIYIYMYKLNELYIFKSS